MNRKLFSGPDENEDEVTKHFGADVSGFNLNSNLTNCSSDLQLMLRKKQEVLEMSNDDEVSEDTPRAQGVTAKQRRSPDRRSMKMPITRK